MSKKLIIPILLLLLVIPFGYAIQGTVTYANQPSSVIAGQQFSVLAQVQLSSFSQSECSTDGCIIELDPWAYNGQPISYVNTGGVPAQSILNLGTYSNSFCDNNPYYAGILTTLGTNNYYQVTLAPKAPLQAGTWSYKVNVYTTCKGNLLLSSSSFSIQVTSSSGGGGGGGTQDVMVYCLNNDKTSCSSQLNNCNSGETKYSTLADCTSNKLSNEGGTAQTANFKLSNLRYVKPSEVSFNQKATTIGNPPNSLYGNLPLGLLQDSQGQVVAVDVTNNGNIASGAYLEAYYISQNNPFLTSAVNSLGGASSVPFFSTFLGKTGINQPEYATCKGETGAKYQLDTIFPGITSTFWLYVPYPSPGDTLAGNNNYDSDKKYLLYVDVIDNCNNKKVYDVAGATVNQFRISPSQQQAAGGGANELPKVDANNTPIDSNKRQKTIGKELIAIYTSQELAKSSCNNNDMCQDNAICQSIDSLVEEGAVSSTKAQKDADEIKKLFESGLALGGGTIGGLAAIKASITAITIGGGEAVAFGSLCATIGGFTAGWGFPVCKAVVGIGGVLVGGALTQKVIGYFNSLTSKDTSSLGYCVPKESVASGTFIKTLTSIGKGLNDSFGGKKKTHLDDLTMGYIILGFVIFIFVIAFTRK